MSKYTYYWCEECGWDSIRSRDDIKGPCPLCAGDTGRDGSMCQRPAREDDGPVEGRDDRFDENEPRPVKMMGN